MTSLLVIGAALTAVLISLTDLAFARAAGLNAPLYHHAPIGWPAPLPILAAPPLAPLYTWLMPTVIAGSLSIAFLLVWFWPTEQRFDTRLFIHALAFDLVIWGALAPAFVFRSFERLTLYSGIPAVAWSLVALAAGAWTVVLIQRKLTDLLMNVFPMWTPGQRLMRWMIMIPLPFGLFAAACWINDYRPGVWASAAALAASLLETLSRRPKERHEEIRNPEMREAAFTLPLVAAGVVALTLFAFGLPHRGTQRAVVLDDGSVKRVRLSALRPLLRFDALRSDIRKDQIEPPELDIRWSKERRKPAVKP